MKGNSTMTDVKGKMQHPLRSAACLTIMTLTAVTFLLLSGNCLAKPVPVAPGHTIAEICDDYSWEKISTCRGFAEGINFDKSGQIILAGVASGEIFKIDGNDCHAIGNPESMPNGAKLHKDGRLFVTDRKLGLMTVDLSTGKRELLVDNYNGEKFHHINDLVFDLNGGLYFTDPANSSVLNPVGRVYYLPPGTDVKVQLFAENLAYPNGIALSADGQRVYIAEFAKNRIISKPVVNAKNKRECAFIFATMQGGLGPDGMAVDSDGNLYAAHFLAKEVFIFDKNGFPYGAIPLPAEAGPGATNIAFHDGYMYVTEGFKSDIWRIKIKKSGAPMFGGL